MRYARIENGRCEVNLPTNGELKNGRLVSGYDKLSHEELINEGWKEFVEDVPIYNQETQYLQFLEKYVETDVITAKYVILDVPEVVYVEPQITDSQRIDELEQVILELSMMIGGA